MPITHIITKSYIAYTRGEKGHSLWAILKPLGWGGAAIVWLRRALYDHGIYSSEEAPLPVISVGNLTTGGTNKTPFVEYIARQLTFAGLHPGIITRGYGGKTPAPVIIRSGNAPRNIVGDEPLLLSRHLPDVPIAVSRDRLRDIKALQAQNPMTAGNTAFRKESASAENLPCEKNARGGENAPRRKNPAGEGKVDIVIADDAFQHRRLAREVDIVLLDPICPFGNGSILPSGILRELPSSLARAHIVVITKADQAAQEQLEALADKVARFVPRERIFYSRLGKPTWAEWDGVEFHPYEATDRLRGVVLFSAIGSPRSFRDTVVDCGIDVKAEISFKDHHHYRAADLRAVEQTAKKRCARALCCTEKDIYNLPRGYLPSLPLLVPRISTRVDDEERFWNVVTEALRPHIVIASNGNGEDAIGARLACVIRSAFPAAITEAFPLVGGGELYADCGIPVDAPFLNSPTGGIIKYHFKDFVQELRIGLLRHIRAQFRKWKSIRGSLRTVLCVGDAYLLCHTILGQGKKALLIATAKTQLISGHWRLESAIYRRACLRVWTRDEQTAAQLRRRHVPAKFEGNPIMDLACDETARIHIWGSGARILILPGSRSRAYQDLKLLLDALEKIALSCQVSAILVVAHTLSPEKLALCAHGWELSERELVKNGLRVKIFCGDVTQVAQGAELLLGLGGTANQVCAGMGIPVLSILEKGKLVQKKLLGDAELLVPPRSDALAECALKLLAHPERRRAMSEAGRSRLGHSGCLAAVTRYAETALGWGVKCAVYEKLKNYTAQKAAP